MKHTRLIGSVVLVGALGISGCSPTLWVKPGANASDFESAKATCDYQSEMGSSFGQSYGMSHAIATGIAEGIQKATLMQKFMVAGGWHPQQGTAPAVVAKESEWSTGYSFGIGGGDCVTWSSDDWLKGCTAGSASKRKTAL